MEVFHASWNARKTAFYEMLWNKSLTVYPWLKVISPVSRRLNSSKKTLNFEIL